MMILPCNRNAFARNAMFQMTTFNAAVAAVQTVFEGIDFLAFAIEFCICIRLGTYPRIAYIIARASDAAAAAIVGIRIGIDGLAIALRRAVFIQICR